MIGNVLIDATFTKQLIKKGPREENEFKFLTDMLETIATQPGKIRRIRYFTQLFALTPIIVK